MLKLISAGMTALFVAGSSLAYADSPGPLQERLSAADMSALTDARISLVKAALQLTPDQDKYWSAVEDAIRSRANARETRLAAMAARVDEMRGKSAIEILRDRNPVEFLRRSADALAQRSAELKKLADAWEPLYQTLRPDQKRRLGFLAVLVHNEARGAMEQRRMEAAEEDED